MRGLAVLGRAIGSPAVLREAEDGPSKESAAAERWCEQGIWTADPGALRATARGGAWVFSQLLHNRHEGYRESEGHERHAEYQDDEGVLMPHRRKGAARELDRDR